MLHRRIHVLIQIFQPVVIVVINVFPGCWIYFLFRQGRIFIPSFQFLQIFLRERECRIYRCWILSIPLVMSLVKHLCPLVTISHQVRYHGTSIDRIASHVINAHLTFGCTFRRDQDHPECPPRSINSRRGCIFKHGNTLDIIRIQFTRITLYSIDQHQCTTSSTDRSCSPHVVFRTSGRITVIHFQIQIRNNTLNTSREVRHRPILKDSSGNLIHRARQVYLFSCSITDNHDLIQPVGFFLQRHINRRSRIPNDLYRFEPD